MAIDRRLLDVLCCPATGVPLKRLTREQLKQLNALIAAGGLRNFGDEPLTQPLDEALITENGERAYPVEDGIPIMLEEKAIPAKAIAEA